MKRSRLSDEQITFFLRQHEGGIAAADIWRQLGSLYQDVRSIGSDSIDADSSGALYSASYDADGNMTSRNGYAISWTPANLQASIASAIGSSTFSYDPDHARYYQSGTFKGTTTDTTCVGGLFIAVSTSTSTINRYGRQCQNHNMSCLVFWLDQRS